MRSGGDRGDVEKDRDGAEVQLIENGGWIEKGWIRKKMIYIYIYVCVCWRRQLADVISGMGLAVCSQSKTHTPEGGMCAKHKEQEEVRVSA